MDIVNLSAEPIGKLHAWLPHDLKAEKVVFLPDACPGKSPLPTGTAVFTHQVDWQRFAVSDCGCGMRLLRSNRSPEDLTIASWNATADALRQNKGSLGEPWAGMDISDPSIIFDDNGILASMLEIRRAD